ncbi:hypothetical protein B7R78_0014770 [Ralstonia solanacearum]|uniref:hypothetical protein n=1 Tax=Ralstonia solanacearum TaxID=305 RepID=UPI001BDF5390|nr:hypothetical protein [Ralstonia solanacearum]MBT1538331.1 hypothetical protein [Ralstonia solanacearum]
MMIANGCVATASRNATGQPGMFQKINYMQLNARQKENFNFQKVAARLADYGFNCLRLSDDWHGADFIACHIDGSTFLKVQLKGRLSIDMKYSGKDIYIAFCDADTWYIYAHDEVRDLLLAKGHMVGSKSWDAAGGYSWPYLSKEIKTIMKKYEI